MFNFQKKTVSQYTFELLGDLSKEHPDEMYGENAINCRDVMFQVLETNLLKNENINFRGMAGALSGLNKYLIHFSPSPNDEPILCDRLYNCVQKLSDPGELRSKTSFRNSLNIIADHGPLMTNQLFRDYIYWHKLFLKWMNSWTYVEKKTAIYACRSFHREISNCIEKRNNPEDLPVLKFFIKYFKDTLQLASSKSYEIRIAICGFGVMAGPCKHLLPEEYLLELLTLVMQRTEYSFHVEESVKRELLEHLPDFVQALSEIMVHVNELPGIQLSSLQNVVISLIRNFHYLSKVHHPLVISSLMKTFYNLSLLGGTVLDDLLSKSILQGIIWTCSHKLSYDIDWDETPDWKENVTYKSYVPFWNGLLNNEISTNEDQNRIANKIYEHMIGSLLLILDKLNLNTVKRTFKDDRGIDQEMSFCDPNIDLNPIKPKDFHIFFNLVDFFKDVLKAQTKHCHEENFKKWIYIFYETIITKFLKYPLISGFLKLLETAFSITDDLNLFVGENDDNRNLQDLIQNFIKNIINRAQHTSGELQLSCLRLLLVAPTIILQPFLMDLIPVFIISFDIGRNMIFLADMALRKLHKISIIIGESVTESNLKKFYQNILPCLDTFLQSRSDLVLNIELEKKKNKRNVKKTFTIGNETKLLKFQQNILIFLGNLEPHICQYLIKSTKTSDCLVKFNIDENLKLILPCTDVKPTIFLDTLMTRVSTLALTSSDRQTKIAASELTHACILYLLGAEKHKSKIWPLLYEKMILLGCDTDLAVQQMFEPLIMQIVHFMSQPSQITNEGTNILIDFLFEFISHPSNNAARDLSARTLREFVIWTIKQTTPEHLASSFLHIDSILEKVSDFFFY